MVAVSEVLPLVGVSVGALLSWGASNITERSRFIREQRGRWRDQRLTSYSEFSVTAKETASVLFRVGAALGVDAQSDPIPLDEARPLLAAAFHNREGAFERLRMVASEDVIAAARAWVREMYVLRSLAESPTLSSAQWTAQLNELSAARDRFYVAARHDVMYEGVNNRST
jgi:hypothetical protein